MKAKTIMIPKKKVLTKDELKHIHNSLRWGMKSDLAIYLGMNNTNITNLLKTKPLYNIQERRFEDKCIMDERVYNQILNFIELYAND